MPYEYEKTEWVVDKQEDDEQKSMMDAEQKTILSIIIVIHSDKMMESFQPSREQWSFGLHNDLPSMVTNSSIIVITRITSMTVWVPPYEYEKAEWVVDKDDDEQKSMKGDEK